MQAFTLEPSDEFPLRIHDFCDNDSLKTGSSLDVTSVFKVSHMTLKPHDNSLGPVLNVNDAGI